MLITDCNAVRIELFKLNYMRGEFILNDKADAEECLNFVVTQMHTWMQSCTTAPDKERAKLLERHSQDDDVTVKLEQLAKTVKCERIYENGVNIARNQPCYIHEMFFLHH